MVLTSDDNFGSIFKIKNLTSQIVKEISQFYKPGLVSFITEYLVKVQWTQMPNMRLLWRLIWQLCLHDILHLTTANKNIYNDVDFFSLMIQEAVTMWLDTDFSSS